MACGSGWGALGKVLQMVEPAETVEAKVAELNELTLAAVLQIQERVNEDLVRLRRRLEHAEKRIRQLEQRPSPGERG